MFDETKKQPPTQADLEKANRFRDAVELERKRRRWEDRRCRAVEWTGGIVTFFGINGAFFILIHKLGVFTLLSDNWGIGPALSSWIIVVLWIGFTFFLVLAFFWISDKTGLHYLIEDWVVSWDTWDAQQSHSIQKYKSFPRRKRRALIRNFKKELDLIADDLFCWEETYDSDDEDLAAGVESLNHAIVTLVGEADISSRSLIHQPEHASWKGFTLALERTSSKLTLELKDIGKYHKDIQPLLKHTSNITSQTLSRIVGYNCEKKERRIIGV